MSTCLVTRARPDGTFDEVGMLNRRPFELKTERGIINRCLRVKFINARRGGKIRMEWFHHLRDKKPFSTTFHVFEPEWQNVEELSGADEHFIRHLLGNVHVSATLLEAAREARPKNMRKAPRAVRRAWVLCVIDTWFANRNLYVGVVRPGMRLSRRNIWGK